MCGRPNQAASWEEGSRAPRERAVRTVVNPRHPAHDSTLRRAGEYEADLLDPNAVVFHNPRKRWTRAFEQSAAPD